MWAYFSKSHIRCTIYINTDRIRLHWAASANSHSAYSDAFDFEYGTVILRVTEGLDVSHIVEAEGQYENRGSTS